MQSSTTLALFPMAVIVASLLILHIGVLGYWVTRWLGYHPADFWMQISVRGGIGLSLLSLETLCLGHLGLLTQPVFWVSSGVMAVGLAAAYPRLAAYGPVAQRELHEAARAEPILAVSCTVLLLVVALSGLRPPTMRDELEYHWAAPLLWAHAGRWIASPYRLTNGPTSAEMLYTLSALFGSYIAAHWTHALFLLVLLASAAALVRALGGYVLAAIAACLSCPCIVNQASVAYNDVAAGALAVSAYAALFCPSQSLPRARLLTAGLLFADAFAVKPFTLVALPVALLYSLRPVPWASQESNSLGAIRRALTLVGPVVVMLGLWMLHTHALTGRLWDTRGQYLARSPADDMWRTGAAAGRIPSARDIALLPAVPVIATIFGQREPYGGRIGLLLLVFVPAGLFSLRRLPEPTRAFAYWLLAAAAAYFFLLGPVAIKTRFHIFVWTLLGVIAACGYTRLRQDHPTPIARLGIASFYLLTWLGMADGAHVLLRGILRLP